MTQDVTDTGTASLYERITRFSKTTRPPQSPTRRSRVKSPKRYEMVTATGMLLMPVLLIFLVKLILGINLIGDILVFGLIGFLMVALVYALSTGLAFYVSRRSQQKKEKWVAAAVLDHETRYEDGIPEKMVILELEDGRRVTLDADPEASEAATPGTLGWAIIRKQSLTKFAAG